MLLLAGCQKETGVTEDNTVSQGSQTNQNSQAGQESHTILDTILDVLQKEEERAEDNPANHGAHAILETEDGYYYNMGYNAYRYAGGELAGMAMNTLLMRYQDKESGKVIVLCNKPECEHRGDDTCAATYKSVLVINSVLYEDWIYIYGLEEQGTMLSLNLYRTALDGSSMDKVGTVFEVDNPMGKEYRYKIDESFTENYYFIIHKGYAYIPYYMHIGSTSSGFQGGGLVQINLKTGETKTLYAMEDRKDAYPAQLCGCGDYVYMYFEGEERAKAGNQRYVISEDRIEWLPSDKDAKRPGMYNAFTAEKYFQLQGIYDSETGNVSEYRMGVWDAVTGEALEEKQFSIDLTSEEKKDFSRVMTYEDMLVLATQERVVFYSIKEETWGEKLGEIQYEHPVFVEMSMQPLYLEYKISNGMLYRISEGERVAAPAGATVGDFQLYEVFGCSLEDIVNGHGEWKQAFFYEVVETVAGK